MLNYQRVIIGKHTTTMTKSPFLWLNQRTKWQFSNSFLCVYQRVIIGWLWILDDNECNVGKTMSWTIQITIFIGGMFTIPTWVVYGIVLPTLSALGKMPDCGEKLFFDRPNRSCTWEHGFFLSTIHGPSTRTNPTNCGFRDLRSLPLSFVSAVRNRSVVASTHPKILIYYDLITNLFDYIYTLLIKHTIFSRLDATLFFSSGPREVLQ